jgi:hypothetical protein
MIKFIHPKSQPIPPNEEPLKALYLCDAQINTSCTKKHCALRGGTCCTTSEVEFALRERSGKPAIVTPFLQLKINSYRVMMRAAQPRAFMEVRK